MTAKGTTWLKLCGDFRVRLRKGRVVIWCREHGRTGDFTPRQAKRFAAYLNGPLGRFYIDAERADRLSLAQQLIDVARRAA